MGVLYAEESSPTFVNRADLVRGKRRPSGRGVCQKGRASCGSRHMRAGFVLSLVSVLFLALWWLSGWQRVWGPRR